MAISSSDAATISSWLISHAGQSTGTDNSNTIANWIRGHWGGSTGTDAQSIASYAEARADTDLAKWGQQLRVSGGST